MSTITSTSIKEKTLELLGQGIGPEMAASALGVTVSYISQLVSDPEFTKEVAERRFKNLAKHNERDNKYDQLEDMVLDKLQDLLCLVNNPLALTKILATLNAAKRRGSSAPQHITNQSTVIPLVIPTQIIQHFQVNGTNQVIKAGTQELVTVQSGQMNKLLEARKAPSPLPSSTPQIGNQNEQLLLSNEKTT